MTIATLSGPTAWANLVGKAERQWSDIAPRFGDQPFQVGHAPGFTVGQDAKFFCMGSCFARNIEEHLTYRGVDVLSKRVVSPIEEWPARPNGFLNKFTTHSMLQEVRWLEEPPADPADHLTETHQGWRDLHLSPGVPPATLERALERRRYLAEEYFPRLRQADIVIMTLGLNEVWRDNDTGTRLNTPPDLWEVRRNPEKFSLEVTDVDENVAALSELRERLKRLNPDMKLVVTVSPVPMSATFSGRDVAVANMLSKSTLRSAADAFQLAHDDVDYFPSYEIVSLSDRAFAYGPDCLHVTNTVVGRIMAQFLDTYCGGVAEAPDGFVELHYFDANPDVEAAVRKGHLASAYEHWVKHGRGEGRALRQEELSARAISAGA